MHGSASQLQYTIMRMSQGICRVIDKQSAGFCMYIQLEQPLALICSKVYNQSAVQNSNKIKRLWEVAEL